MFFGVHRDFLLPDIEIEIKYETPIEWAISIKTSIMNICFLFFFTSIQKNFQIDICGLK